MTQVIPWCVHVTKTACLSVILYRYLANKPAKIMQDHSSTTSYRSLIGGLLVLHDLSVFRVNVRY